MMRAQFDNTRAWVEAEFTIHLIWLIIGILSLSTDNLGRTLLNGCVAYLLYTNLQKLKARQKPSLLSFILVLL